MQKYKPAYHSSHHSFNPGELLFVFCSSFIELLPKSAIGSSPVKKVNSVSSCRTLLPGRPALERNSRREPCQPRREAQTFSPDVSRQIKPEVNPLRGAGR